MSPKKGSSLSATKGSSIRPKKDSFATRLCCYCTRAVNERPDEPVGYFPVLIESEAFVLVLHLMSQKIPLWEVL
jgi:hypothetical protein